VADITKVGSPSLSTLEPMPGAGKLPALICGEAIAAGDACYIKASDGCIWKSDATDGLQDSQVHGYAPIAGDVGQPLTLVFNVCFRYGSSLTPGAALYLSANAGLIADAPIAGPHAPAPLGFVVDDTRVYLRQSAVATVP
jgi:hypothetical protein